MNGLMKFSVVALAAVTLAACGTQRDKARGVVSSQQGYQGELSRGYLQTSNWEHGEGDYRDSDKFARKSMAASAGENVPAPNMGDWNIPAEYSGEISAASQRLNSALSKGAASVAPADTANAQVMLDCWMQEAEENWPFQEEDRAYCRDSFNESMAKIEAALAPAPVAAVPPGSYLVFFDFAKYNLTPEAVDIVNSAAAGIKPGTSVHVIGNTDTVGSAEFNFRLGAQRADAVADQLISAGVSPSAITTESRGEESPLVPTGDGVAEPQNRRAEIVVGKPAM